MTADELYQQAFRGEIAALQPAPAGESPAQVFACSAILSYLHATSLGPVPSSIRMVAGWPAS